MQTISAKTGNGGYAFGKLFVHGAFVQPAKAPATSVPQEQKRYDYAKKEAEESYASAIESARKNGDMKGADILEAQMLMLQDEGFSSTISRIISRECVNAEYAVFQGTEEFAQTLEQQKSDYLKARSADIRSVGRKLCGVLQNVSTDAAITSDTIVFAQDISPEEILGFDKKHLKALVTQNGSDVSHTAILAGTYALPYLFGIETDCVLPHGAEAIVDGEKGLLIVEPDEETRATYECKMRQRNEQSLRLPENLPIKLCANIAGPDDLDMVEKYNAQGIGLFRTEFLYMNRTQLPSEDEQFEVYKTVAEAMKGKEVVIRTLDIGTDKRTECLTLPQEENPALGKRAIRICLEDTALFRSQLRAIMRAANYGNLKIMYPMIASAWEIEELNEQLHIAAEELAAAGAAFSVPDCGIMIETPAAALISDHLATKVKFFSIGTNDLTQYTLAADRRGRGLERYFDARHEAVFRLIELTTQNAHKHGIPVSICGEMGSDASVIPRLIDIGIDKLSMSPAKIPGAGKAAAEYVNSLKGSGNGHGSGDSEKRPGDAVFDLLTAAVDGVLVPMNEIPDEAFSSGALGACFAIEPDDGRIYAPCDGEVTMVAQTKHAIGIHSDKGNDILIHAGINTVSLQGEGFECKVELGAHVEQGELILVENLDFIRAKQLSAMVIVVYGQ